nr:Gfo/Idh/MocA family oxidoreductase [bacterium]
MPAIKLFIIGCGDIAYGTHAPHLKALADAGDIQVIGCCDLIPERARAMAEIFDAPWCVDYHDMLEGCDAVWVCTEAYRRRPIIEAAAALGKHIFAEKPLALNLEDGRAMVEAARKAGVIYMTGYCLRFFPGFRQVRDVVASGVLGDIVHVTDIRIVDTDKTGVWYGQVELSGGTITDFGSHDIDFMRFLGGNFTQAYATKARVRDTVTIEEFSAATLKFASGASATFETSWCTPLSTTFVGVQGTRGNLVYDGKTIRYKLLDSGETVTYQKGEAIPGVPEDPAILHGETIQQHFVRCIKTGLKPLTDAGEAYETLKTIVAIRKSAAQGCAVAVEG